MTRASAFPAKRFFVDMLVRDIELKDALLDLLDNCVDGAMRMNAQHAPADPARPYTGFWAKIDFRADTFSIKDNCGGIPLQVATESAFQLGRKDFAQDAELPTVGLYGIGMKRAIFKLGTRCRVTSSDGNDAFYVDITPEWMASDDDWDLELTAIDVAGREKGTDIVVTELRDGVSRSFGMPEFETDFRRATEDYYSYIIEKGFQVEINGTPVAAKKIRLLLDEQPPEGGKGIAPYVYRRRDQQDGINILLTVGLYRPMPSDDDEEQQLSGRASSESAGWTIICNDRVVLHADKSRATGWGEAGVPNYHTQFASIAGVVIFQSNDPRLLPLTTTKRGIDGNSDLYLQVKDFMRDGLKVFTDFTNSWKRRPKERAALQEQVQAQLPEVLESSDRLTFRAVRKPIGGERFAPDLPAPATYSDTWIRFSRPNGDIQTISNFLYGHTDANPSEVGAACFDKVLAEVQQ